MHKYIFVHVLPYTFQQISLQKKLLRALCNSIILYMQNIVSHSPLLTIWTSSEFSTNSNFQIIFRMKNLPKRIKICNSSWPTCLAHSLEDTPTTMHSLLHFYHNPTSCRYSDREEWSLTQQPGVALRERRISLLVEVWWVYVLHCS